MNLPYMNRPCGQCPFRKDCAPGWLGKERMIEITDSGSFICHKTSKGSDSDRRQCAGHMMLLENDNDFVQLANRMSLKLDLRGRETIFDNTQDCIDHHKNQS